MRPMIDGLLYVSHDLRPDDAFPVNNLSWFQNCAIQMEKLYAKRVVKYLHTTIDHKLVYRSNGNGLEAYVDASFVPEVGVINVDQGDLEGAKSISHCMLFNFGDMVHWAICRQGIVTTLLAAVEMVAVDDAMDDVFILQSLAVEFVGGVNIATVFEDNLSCAKVLMGGGQKRVRSIAVKCANILDAQKRKEIWIVDCPGEKMLTSMLTKALDHGRLEMLVRCAMGTKLEAADS